MPRESQCTHPLLIFVLGSTAASALTTRTPVEMSGLLPKSLSPSSITTWKQCPLLFKFRYLEKRPQGYCNHRQRFSWEGVKLGKM